MRWKKGNRLRLVGEADAGPRVRAIFDEVRHAMGTPVVPSLYQAYAAFPEFLELHWVAFKPAVASRQFFQLGARLAAESYTRAHSYFEVQDLTPYLPESGQSNVPISIAQVLDYYQYLDPLLLLITAAQMQALEGPVGDAGTPDAAQHPWFPTPPPSPSTPEAATAFLRMWEERRRTLDLAFVSGEHRALAVWPDFYQAYWRALKSLVDSPLYGDCQYRIGESAWGLVRELPVRVETSIPQLLDAGLTEDEVSSLSRINEALVAALSGIVLDVTFARIACEGGTRHQPQQPTPVAPPEQKDAGTASAPRAA